MLPFQIIKCQKEKKMLEEKKSITDLLHQSGFQQRNRTIKYTYRVLLQEIGICDSGSWLGKSEICVSGCQGGLAGNSLSGADAAGFLLP